MVKKLICLTILLLSANTSEGALLFSGDFTSAEGQVEITAPISFTITGDGEVREVVLDEIVPTDLVAATMALGSVNYSINGSGSSSAADFRDNGDTIEGDVSLDDGLFIFRSYIPVSNGDVFVIEAQTFSGIGTPSISPEYNTTPPDKFSFDGDIFLVDADRNRISTIANAASEVPEPGSGLLLGLFIGGAFRSHRRRRVSEEENR
jgi:hypothetical protein